MTEFYFGGSLITEEKLAGLTAGAKFVDYLYDAAKEVEGESKARDAAYRCFEEDMASGHYRNEPEELEKMFSEFAVTAELENEEAHDKARGEFLAEYREDFDELVNVVFCNTDIKLESGIADRSMKQLELLIARGYAVIKKDAPTLDRRRKALAGYTKMIDDELSKKNPWHYGFGDIEDKGPFSRQHSDSVLLPVEELHNLLNLIMPMEKCANETEAETMYKTVEINYRRITKKILDRELCRELNLEEKDFGRLNESLAREAGAKNRLTETQANNYGTSLTWSPRLKHWGEELKKYLEENSIYGSDSEKVVRAERERSGSREEEWAKRAVFTLADGFRIEMMPVYEGDSTAEVNFYRPTFRGEDRNGAEHGGERIVKAEWKLPANTRKGSPLYTMFADELIGKNRGDNLRLVSYIAPVEEKAVTRENGGAMEYRPKNDSKALPFGVADAIYSYPRQSDRTFKVEMESKVPAYSPYSDYDAGHGR